ncbi:nuclear transport factor 2 family protein [Roseateles sp. NT4]|uniref:nuclear transport factor 2 family protein n=1 Tax=Roseateles sp. NT4 TaxID=3453715 RepID=UPI003EE9A490
MTTTPTQVIQSMYAAFGRGDVEGLLGLCTPDVEWTMLGSIDLPYIGQFQGQQALLRWFGLVAEFDDIQAFEPREFFAGDDHVTVLGWERTRAKPGQGVFETPGCTCSRCATARSRASSACTTPPPSRWRGASNLKPRRGPAGC